MTLKGICLGLWSRDIHCLQSNWRVLLSEYAELLIISQTTVDSVSYCTPRGYSKQVPMAYYCV